MSVVLRCPSCGTTRAAPGECEACHEAQARYFCTNHKPGVGLVAASCPQCGARYGDPKRTSSSRSPAPAARSATAATSVPTAPGREARPSLGPARPSRTIDASPVARRVPVAPARRDELEPIGLRMPIWQQLIAAALRARTRPSETAHPSAPALGRRVGGCLLRLVGIGLVLLLLLVGALFLFGRSLLQGSSYY